MLSHFIEISLFLSFITTGILLVILSVVYFISKPLLEKTIWFGLTTYITMITLGILVTHIHHPKNHKNHYTTSQIFTKDSIASVTLKISSALKSNVYNDKYVVSILKINQTSVAGFSVLNIRKDSTSQAYNVDDILIIKTQIQPLKVPLNPNQFNYKRYLENNYIYSHMHTSYKDVFIASTVKSTLHGFADAFRKHLNSKLEKHHFKSDELAVINALLLGQRKELSESVYNDYKNAGSIHILAVSGLHVGIILLFLNFIFKPLEYLKHGHVYKIIVIVICLWSFAIITGLSASVLRAALMFSFVALAINLKRPKNTLNVLASSAFVLLLLNPNLLFDVGFQLSYLAVIAIVTIYPILYSFWHSKYWLIDKFWQAFIISIAAQLGVLPISVFYFHQIPGLFLLSNVVIIPFLGFILGYGIVVILLASISLLPDFIAKWYGTVISWMNNFFKWIAQQEAFLIQDISFNMFHVLSGYLLIITAYQLYIKRSYPYVLSFIIVLLIGQTSFIYTKYATQTKQQFVVFHKAKSSLIGVRNGETLQLDHNLTKITEVKSKMITNYAITNHISEIHEDSIQYLYQINKKWLLVIDSLGIYNIKSVKPDYVLLKNSPHINLNRLIDSLQPQVIIADGSNYKSYMARWETTCKKQKLLFHQTNKKGAFVIELNID